MPTPSYVSSGSVTRGVTTAQTGINIESNRERFDDPKDYILDRFGGRTGFAHAFDKSSTVTMSGEVTTADDLILGVAFATSLTVANQIDGYGTTTGGNYLDDIEVESTREGKKSCTVNLTRISGLT